MEELIVESPAFKHGEKIPPKYTCDGEDINPEIIISNILEGTKSVILIMDDPDAPMGTWLHWLLYNIPPKEKIVIKENSVPGEQVTNSFGRKNYGGPCPPGGRHRYYFTSYAVNTTFNEAPAGNREEFEAKHADKIISKGTLMGYYSRQNQ